MKKMSKKAIAMLVSVLLMLAVLPMTVSAAEVNTTQPLETMEGTNSYALFNSGCTSSYGYSYDEIWDVDHNPSSDSYTNDGYDIYGGHSYYEPVLTLRLGLSFCVTAPVTENGILTVYAFDVDEDSSRTEIDEIYLVNDTTGERTYIDYLKGMDWTWTTSTLSIPAELFQQGESYHFEMDISIEGWEVWVRRVSLELTCGEYRPGAIEDANFTATIDNNGKVSTNLYLQTNKDLSYGLEYIAVIDSDQKGGKEIANVDVSPAGTTITDSFYLDPGAPRGVYQIHVVLKDANGNTKATYSHTASYGYSTVSYKSNGGSQNLPVDLTPYENGSTVTVRFDTLPSRAGYVFLGWAHSATATVPEYTANGNNTFVIGSEDVSLYAVWHVHVYDNAYDPDCNECGAVREVIDAPDAITFVGTSATEEVGGLGFLYKIHTSNVQLKWWNFYVSGSATVIYEGSEYTLVTMGAILNNQGESNLSLDMVDGEHTINIQATRMYDLTEDALYFAVRSINMPINHVNTPIHARPYMILEKDGAQFLVYGDVESDTYMNALNSQLL